MAGLVWVSVLEAVLLAQALVPRQAQQPPRLVLRQGLQQVQLALWQQLVLLV